MDEYGQSEPMTAQAEHWLSIENATVVRGKSTLVKDINLRLALGDHTVVLGANGSGKSTLVKLITAQIYPLFGGTVRVFGEERWPVFELRRHLGIVSSSLQLDFNDEPPLEVLDCVVSGFFAARGVWRHHKVTDAQYVRAEEALSLLRADHLRGRSMSELSTGEARRVLIARALVHGPKVLLLDEPCAGLDPVSRHAFLADLRRIAQQGVTLLLVTHHVEEILPEINHVVQMRHGQVWAEGPKSTLLTSDGLSEVFGAPIRVEPHGNWFSARVE